MRHYIKGPVPSVQTLSGHPLGSEADMEFHRRTGSQLKRARPRHVGKHPALGMPFGRGEDQ